MKVISIVIILVATSIFTSAQNENDALRYSVPGFGGSSRVIAMGGAFGAVGADVSCAAYNPAGLAIFRKGDISYSAGVRINHNKTEIYNGSTSANKTKLNFSNFGFATIWPGRHNPNNRNVIALTVTQLANFNQTLQMKGYTNSSSIAKDMLNLAEQKQQPGALNSFYEGLGFATYLLDTAEGKFFSFVDTKRSVLQTRDVTTSGKLNETNISLAQSLDDKLYYGGSIGLPRIRYTSTTKHTEWDDKDSMRVTVTSPSSYSTTYIGGLPGIYSNLLGFNDLVYTEYFETTGRGINLKLGAVLRASDMLRLGVYYHSPTLYSLSESYYNSLNVTFDAQRNNAIKDTVPENADGFYMYRLVTPSRVGFNAAVIIKKLAVIAIDYENVNYSRARFSSEQASEFSAVNSYINSQYSQGHNLRIGAELNTKPLMYRVGYNITGSPYGRLFSGDYVRHIFSTGIGYRTEKNYYFDLSCFASTYKQRYHLFKTFYVNTILKNMLYSLTVTAGFKF